MLAIQDALAEFQADEIVVALHPETRPSSASEMAASDIQASVARRPGARPRSPGRRLSVSLPFRRCACSSPAAPGFIGSHFVRRLVAAGDEVVVLDKLTYAGNPANLDGLDVAPRDRRHRRRRRRRARGQRLRCRGQLRRRDARRPLDPRRRAISCTPTSSAPRCCSSGLADDGARYVQVSTDEVYGDLERGGRSDEDDPLRPSSPYSASKAGGDLQVLAYVRTYGVNASITRGANTYGPNQYPEKLIPLFTTNALDGLAAARLRRRQAGAGMAARRGPLRGSRARPARGRAG